MKLDAADHGALLAAWGVERTPAVVAFDPRGAAVGLLTDSITHDQLVATLRRAAANSATSR